MKNIIRVFSLTLAFAALLCACTTGDGDGTTTTTKPQPTTQPLPVIADVNRPLPVLPEKVFIIFSA